MTVLDCVGLAKHYGRVQALDSLDLSLDAGQPVALIGPNGAGKTTLLSLLCGYIRPSRGSATVLGHAVGSRSLVGQLAALPQDAQLDPHFSVDRQLRHYAELQGLSTRAARLEAQRVLQLVQLQDAGATKPGALSHGMRKRISIAQALLGQPRLILLDEPTAGIDPPNVKIIRDLIREQSSQATFIISSHNLDELERLCHWVVYLESGRLVSSEAIDADGRDRQQAYLTLRLGDVPEEAFIAAASGIAGIKSVRRQAQGDYLIECAGPAAGHVEASASGSSDPSAPALPVDQALLGLLAQRDWSYRHLINGRSLEDRLYGESP